MQTMFPPKSDSLVFSHWFCFNFRFTDRDNPHWRDVCCGGFDAQGYKSIGCKRCLPRDIWICFVYTSLFDEFENRAGLNDRYRSWTIWGLDLKVISFLLFSFSEDIVEGKCWYANEIDTVTQVRQTFVSFAKKKLIKDAYNFPTIDYSNVGFFSSFICVRC